MWTPASEYEENNWVVTLQRRTDSGEWLDFDYTTDVVNATTQLTFYATFVAEPCPYRDRQWRLILVDESKFTESNTETLAEMGDMQLVPKAKGSSGGETNWFATFTVPAIVSTVGAVRIGMVDQKAREAKVKNPSARTPLGITAPHTCNVG